MSHAYFSVDVRYNGCRSTQSGLDHLIHYVRITQTLPLIDPAAPLRSAATEQIYEHTKASASACTLVYECGSAFDVDLNSVSGKK